MALLQAHEEQQAAEAPQRHTALETKLRDDPELEAIRRNVRDTGVTHFKRIMEVEKEIKEVGKLFPNKELAEAWDQRAAGAITQEEFDARNEELMKRFEEVSEMASELNRRHAEIADEFKQAPFKALELPESERLEVTTHRPAELRTGLGKTGKTIELKTLDKEYKTKMAKATDFVSKITARRDDLEETNVTVHRLPKGERAFHINNEDEFGGGVWTSSQAPESTYVHELGHHLEGKLPGAEQLAQDFKDMRIARAGTQNFPLAERFPERGYRPDEIGNEDGFRDAFGDRAAYVGKDYGRRATEIVSMGLEELYRNPAVFAGNDPEYFKFTVGLLRGTL